MSDFIFRLIPETVGWLWWRTSGYILYIRDGQYHFKTHIPESAIDGFVDALWARKSFDISARVYYNGKSLIMMSGDEAVATSTYAILLTDAKKHEIAASCEVAHGPLLLRV
jgi:hypothetical protein